MDSDGCCCDGTHSGREINIVVIKILRVIGVCLLFLFNLIFLSLLNDFYLIIIIYITISLEDHDS